MVIQKCAIPIDVQNEITTRVETFNRKHLGKTHCKYCPKFKGKFIYLMRFLHDGRLEHVCRLTYSGFINDMDFAIYKYSTEKYDPNEWWFDGYNLVNGTVEGAMKAGLKAYPV